MGMTPDLRPEDQPRELALKALPGAVAVPTGIGAAAGRYMHVWRGVPWVPPPRDRPALEQAKEFLRRTRDVY
jgi:hypothetical protein